MAGVSSHPRQCLFTGAESRGRDELEEGTASEEIQVGGVWVVGQEKALAGFAAAGPSSFQARDALPVVLDRACGSVPCLQHPVVPHRQHQEAGERHEKPGGRALVPNEDQPGHQNGQANRGQPEIRQLFVPAVQRLLDSRAGVQSGGVRA